MERVTVLSKQNWCDDDSKEWRTVLFTTGCGWDTGALGGADGGLSGGAPPTCPLEIRGWTGVWRWSIFWIRSIWKSSLEKRATDLKVQSSTWLHGLMTMPLRRTSLQINISSCKIPQISSFSIWSALTKAISGSTIRMTTWACNRAYASWGFCSSMFLASWGLFCTHSWRDKSHFYQTESWKIKSQLGWEQKISKNVYPFT